MCNLYSHTKCPKAIRDRGVNRPETGKRAPAATQQKAKVGDAGYGRREGELKRQLTMPSSFVPRAGTEQSPIADITTPAVLAGRARPPTTQEIKAMLARPILREGPPRIGRGHST